MVGEKIEGKRAYTSSCSRKCKIICMAYEIGTDRGRKKEKLGGMKYAQNIVMAVKRPKTRKQSWWQPHLLTHLPCAYIIKSYKNASVKTKFAGKRKKCPYPVKDVLKTTSPTWVPEAPNDLALHMEPSSSTSLASASFHGLSPKPMSQHID